MGGGWAERPSGRAARETAANKSLVTRWNKGAERLYGWSAQRAIGDQMAALFPKQDKPALAVAEQALLAHGEWTGELRKHTQKDQEVVVSSRWTRESIVAGSISGSSPWTLTIMSSLMELREETRHMSMSLQC